MRINLIIVRQPLRSLLPHYRLLVQFAALAALLCVLSGCIAFYSYRDVLLEIRDGDTGEPYSQTVVEILYPTMFVLNPPEWDEDITGRDGQVVLRMATYPGLLRIHGGPELRQPIFPGLWVDRSYVRDGGVLEYFELYPADRDPWSVTIAFDPK